MRLVFNLISSLLLVKAVNAHITTLEINTVYNFTNGDSLDNVVQSKNANSTVINDYFQISHYDLRTLYYKPFSISHLAWDPTSTDCQRVIDFTYPSDTPLVYVNSEGYDLNNLDCIVDDIAFEGDTVYFICCNVTNLGYMPLYQYGLDNSTSYHNVTELYPYKINETYPEEEIQFCCQTEEDQNTTACTCDNECCSDEVSHVCYVENCRAEVPIGNPPTFAPSIQQTSYPTAGPTVSPSLSPTVRPSLSPTVSPTTYPTISPTVSPTKSPVVCINHSDCNNDGRCFENMCNCHYPYYGTQCQDIKECKCQNII